MGQTKKSAVDKKLDVAARFNIWPWVAIIGVIIAAAVIRGRLLSVPFERDEGEYAYIAQQMLKGVPPYVSAYSMKLPGIYVVYALIMTLFGQTHTGVHLGLLIFNAATIFVVFLLAKKIFGSIAAVAAGGVYAVLSITSGVTGLWANAEHFVILPALVGILLICNSNGKTGYVRLLIAGLLFGLAFIIKQHGIMFAIFGALYLLYSGLRQRPIQWLKVIISQIIFNAVVLLPFVLVCLFYWFYGTFDKFWFWTFTYAREYAAGVSLDAAWELLTYQAKMMFYEGFPIWFLSVFGFFAVVVMRRYRQLAALAAGFFIFSFLAVCPGFYFRNHYFIFLLPAAAILAGVGIAVIDGLYAGTMPMPMRLAITGSIGLIVIGYTLYDQQECLFTLSPEDVCRKVYSVNPFPESLQIAKFIRDNSRPDAPIAVVGSEPQICFYSDRRSATKYIYTYPLMEPQPYAMQMQEEMIAQIETANPEFVIFINVPMSWLARPNSVQKIFGWFDSYLFTHYEVVGIADILGNRPTIWRWNNQATNYKPVSVASVVVLKRKQ
ncbi:MAG: glycosyltransferase family 39 protein [Sedimentisphaerales bacterium]